jgi:hypothetical protein
MLPGLLMPIDATAMPIAVQAFTIIRGRVIENEVLQSLEKIAFKHR